MKKKVKGLAGVGLQMVFTALGILTAWLLAYTFDEDVHFYGAVLSLVFSFAVIGVVYLSWYLKKEVQVRDQDLRHYKKWWIPMLIAIVSGSVPGTIAGAFVCDVWSYTAWVYFVAVSAGVVFQLIGSLLAYTLVRPR